MSEQFPCEDLRAQGLSSSTYVRMECLLAGYVLRPLQGGARTEVSRRAGASRLTLYPSLHPVTAAIWAHAHAVALVAMLASCSQATVDG